MKTCHVLQVRQINRDDATAWFLRQQSRGWQRCAETNVGGSSTESHVSGVIQGHMSREHISQDIYCTNKRQIKVKIFLRLIIYASHHQDVWTSGGIAPPFLISVLDVDNHAPTVYVAVRKA
jgi:hypothetical protein